MPLVPPETSATLSANNPLRKVIARHRLALASSAGYVGVPRQRCDRTVSGRRQRRRGIGITSCGERRVPGDQPGR